MILRIKPQTKKTDERLLGRCTAAGLMSGWKLLIEGRKYSSCSVVLFTSRGVSSARPLVRLAQKDDLIKGRKGLKGAAWWPHCRPAPPPPKIRHAIDI